MARTASRATLTAETGEVTVKVTVKAVKGSL